jgi:excisionase family DNA binding protein
MAEQLERMLTIAEVSRSLGCCEATTKKFIRLGQLKASKLNRKMYRIKTSDFDSFINNGLVL